MVPLVSSFMLSTKEGKKAWVEPVLDPDAQDGWRFEVRTGALSKYEEEKFRTGTKAARGNFRCLLTGSAISEEYNRSQGFNGQLGERLIAIIAEGSSRRLFLTPSKRDEELAQTGDATVMPQGELYPRALGFRVPAYGLNTWSKLYTQRQLTALSTFSRLLSEAKEQVDGDIASYNSEHPSLPFSRFYSSAITTYLAFLIDQIANHCSTLCGWNSANTQMRSVFSKQALSMTWDFAEVNVFSDSSGSYASLFDRMIKGFSGLPFNVECGNIEQADARIAAIPENATVSTDPPYYDNIGYADLSDFFYSWLRPNVGHLWPELFRRLLTPKEDELVATPHRHGGSKKAHDFFMEGMRTSLTNVSKKTAFIPTTIFYAFKQSDTSVEGTSSAGWASFLQAVVDSGLLVDGTWPLDTEKKGRTRDIGTNALASSIVLVCRKRPADAPTIGRAAFVRALKREMPEAIEAIRKAGVGPVDMQQSVIGPGMGVFSRNAAVREDDDSPMSVRTALAIINRVWAEIEDELDGEFDAPTQVALAWYGQHGFEAKPSGELIMLANAKNTADRALFASGVFTDGRGRSGLTPREQLPPGWSPAADRSPTVWECVQHTARTLAADDGGTLAAARLVAGMGARAAEARKLAERLFSIATNNGWSAEALVYNELAEEWPRLEEMAMGLAAAAPAPAAPAQALLI